MKISVYIPSYNQEELLKEAIDSVLSQSLRPFEIIIVDDCSEDQSRELIMNYHSKYPELIKYHFHERNQGIAKVRVQALSMVEGDFVTYVDGDDLLDPKKLEVEIKLMENGNFDLTFSNTAYFSNDWTHIERLWISNIEDMPKSGNMYFETFMRLFPRDSLFRMELVNMNLLKTVGFHDTRMKIYEDYELRIRLAKKAKINFSLLPLAYVRMDSHSLSKSRDELHYDSYKFIHEKHYKDVIGMFPNRKDLVDLRFEKFFRKYSGQKLTFLEKAKRRFGFL